MPSDLDQKSDIEGHSVGDVDIPENKIGQRKKANNNRRKSRMEDKKLSKSSATSDRMQELQRRMDANKKLLET